MNNKFFRIAFLVTFIVFVFVNIYSIATVQPPCCDLFGSFGIPFAMGEFGGYYGQTHYFAAGFVVDIVFWLAASILSGWLFPKVFPLAVAGGVRVVLAAAGWHARTRL